MTSTVLTPQNNLERQAVALARNKDVRPELLLQEIAARTASTRTAVSTADPEAAISAPEQI